MMYPAVNNEKYTGPPKYYQPPFSSLTHGSNKDDADAFVTKKDAHPITTKTGTAPSNSALYHHSVIDNSHFVTGRRSLPIPKPSFHGSWIGWLVHGVFVVWWLAITLESLECFLSSSSSAPLTGPALTNNSSDTGASTANSMHTQTAETNDTKDTLLTEETPNLGTDGKSDLSTDQKCDLWTGETSSALLADIDRNINHNYYTQPRQSNQQPSLNRTREDPTAWLLMTASVLELYVHGRSYLSKPFLASPRAPRHFWPWYGGGWVLFLLAALCSYHRKLARFSHLMSLGESNRIRQATGDLEAEISLRLMRQNARWLLGENIAIFAVALGMGLLIGWPDRGRSKWWQRAFKPYYQNPQAAIVMRAQGVPL